MHSRPNVQRSITIGVLQACLPAAAHIPPLIGLALLVLIIATLVIVETIRYADVRRTLRST